MSDVLQVTRNDALVMAGKSDDEPPTKRICKRSQKEGLKTGTFNFTNFSVVLTLISS